MKDQTHQEKTTKKTIKTRKTKLTNFIIKQSKSQPNKMGFINTTHKRTTTTKTYGTLHTSWFLFSIFLSLLYCFCGWFIKIITFYPIALLKITFSIFGLISPPNSFWQHYFPKLYFKYLAKTLTFSYTFIDILTINKSQYVIYLKQTTRPNQYFGVSFK